MSSQSVQCGMCIVFNDTGSVHIGLITPYRRYYINYLIVKRVRMCVCVRVRLRLRVRVRVCACACACACACVCRLCMCVCLYACFHVCRGMHRWLRAQHMCVHIEQVAYLIDLNTNTPFMIHVS